MMRTNEIQTMVEALRVSMDECRFDFNDAIVLMADEESGEWRRLRPRGYVPGHVPELGGVMRDPREKMVDPRCRQHKGRVRCNGGGKVSLCHG